jgi:hypothetical protein
MLLLLLLLHSSCTQRSFEPYLSIVSHQQGVCTQNSKVTRLCQHWVAWFCVPGKLKPAAQQCC